MLIGLTYGQESSQKKNIKDDLNYEFLIKNYLATVKSLPNNLWLWDKGDFSVMNFNAGKDDGDFNKTDGFNYNEYIGFENESILSIDNTWRFYGKFKIKVSNHEGTNWNLFFKRNFFYTKYLFLILSIISQLFFNFYSVIYFFNYCFLYFNKFCYYF